MKDVFAIFDGKEGERSRWLRIGVAFDNKDGSLNVLLDAVPLTGRLQIRSREREDDPAADGGRKSGARRSAATGE